MASLTIRGVQFSNKSNYSKQLKKDKFLNQMDNNSHK